jgi:catechol 2,3-dioxygenase-like lactoylglutathione lyase family enzyme
MPPVRLQHVSVQVPREQLDDCIGFYEGLLELRRIPNLAGIAWFEVGDTGDHVHLLEGPGGGSSSGHLALQVVPLAPVLARLRGAGHELRAGSVIWGAERWFVRDPAGNLVELFETPPPAAAR